MTDHVSRVSHDFSEGLSSEMSFLMSVFSEQYNDALKMRMEPIQERVRNDAVKQGTVFTNKISQIRTDAFQATLQKASNKVQNQIEILSNAIVNSVSGNTSKIVQDMEITFTQAFNEQSTRDRSSFSEEYKQYIHDFSDILNQIRETSSAETLKLVGQRLRKNHIDDLSTSIASVITENISDIIKNIELSFTQNLSQKLIQTRVDYEQEFGHYVKTLQVIRRESMEMILDLIQERISHSMHGANSEIVDELSEKLMLQIREMLDKKFPGNEGFDG